MTCGDTSSDCMAVPMGSWICPAGMDECAACCWPFSEAYDFYETNDPGHRCCWVGIRSLADSCYTDEGTGELGGEAREGRWCGYGCAGTEGDKAAGPNACDDRYLADMSDEYGGPRWLLPDETADRFRDARGMIHDLRSDEYHPIPPVVNYRRGACWTNGGVEALGIDACRCLGRYRPIVYSGDYPGLGCGEGHPINSPIPDHEEMPDTHFRGGYGWPPRAVGGCINSGQLASTYNWCRQYESCRLAEGVRDVRVVALGRTEGGLAGIAEGLLTPAFMSAKACTANVLVYLLAYTGRDSPCGTSVWNESGHTQSHYMTDTRYRDLYSRLRLYAPTDRPVYAIAVDPDDPADGLMRNKVLRFVQTRPFGDLNFEHLDSLVYGGPGGGQGNGGLSKYARYWEAEPDSEGLTVDGAYTPYGNCRLQQSGLPVIATMRIMRVLYYAVVIPEALTPDYRPANEHRLVEPHIELQIIVQTVTDVRFADAEPTWLQEWRRPTDPKRLRHLELKETMDNRGYQSYTVVDQFGNEGVDTIEYRDSDDRLLTPPLVVEWRGHLGRHGPPALNCIEQRDMIGNMPTVHLAERWENGKVVSGLPMFAETRSEEPSGVFQGHMLIGFGP